MSARNISVREAEAAVVVSPSYQAIDARIRFFRDRVLDDCTAPSPVAVPGIGLVWPAPALLSERAKMGEG